MLLELQVANFILLRKETIPFASGLNIISGASGAGKTIVVKALKLLSGDRASSELIGPFGTRTIVEGYFRLDPERFAALAGNADFVADTASPGDQEGEFVALRTLDASGDNRCYLNGRAVTLQFYRRVMGPIMEIAGQEGFSALARPGERAAILDRYADSEGIRAEFAQALQEARTLRERLRALRAGAAERRDRADLLTFQIGEIARLGLERGETARIREEHRLLSSLGQVRDALGAGRQDLYEGDGSVADRIGAVLRSLETLPASGEGRLEECAEALRKSLASIEDAAFIMRDLQEELDADPERLAAVEQRDSEIQRILHRYGPTEDDLFVFLEHLEEEYARINVSAEDLENLEAELAGKIDRIARLGRKLDKTRRHAARSLSAEVGENLGLLLMREVRFTVDVGEPCFDDILETASASGPSAIRFLVASNPGTKAAPVERIASGGERSRIFLALLSALGRCSGTPLMIFDEIDENVGSRLGTVVGDMLNGLGSGHQVIAVTHIPAIAARGALHHKVDKTVAQKSAFVTVRRLEGKARALEVAEMLAGPSPPETAVKEALRVLSAGEDG